MSADFYQEAKSSWECMLALKHLGLWVYFLLVRKVYLPSLLLSAPVSWVVPRLLPKMTSTLTLHPLKPALLKSLNSTSLVQTSQLGYKWTDPTS